MSIKSELMELQKADESGLLHPTKVIDWAQKHIGSALHSAIDWNDKTAAHAHRMWQVRQLIQVHIVAEDGAPQMVSLTIDRHAGGGYRRMADVLRAPDLRGVMLADALAELDRVRKKYECVAELARVWAEAAVVEEKVGRRPRRRSAAPATSETVAS